MADPVATVTAVTGKAFAVDASGKSRPIKVGDKLLKGEKVVTDAGARVELLMLDGKMFAVEQSQQITLDSDVASTTRPVTQEGQVTGGTVESVIQALTTGGTLDNLDATAAGLGGGAGGDGSGFVRLLRIVEGTDPLNFEFVPLDASVPPPEVIDPELVTVIPQISVSVGEGGGLISGPIAVGVDALSVVEGTGPETKVITFFITLDVVATTNITVTYTIVPGTAGFSDFFNGPMTGTVTIPAGFSGFSVTVYVVEDSLVEGNETFYIVLSNPIGATLLNDTAMVTIIDDDVSVAATNAQVDETGGFDSVSGNLNADFGPGDTGTISLAATGATWNSASNTLTADNGSWRVVVNTGGTYTFTQLAAMSHPNAANPDDPLAIQITATATDNMVPANSNTTSFTVTVRDDGPSVTTNLTVRLDDDALTGGIAGGTGDDVNAENTSGTLSHNYGADSNGSIAYLTLGAPSGFTYEAGTGSSLLVKQGATTVMTLTLDTATGAYTVTQNAPIMHEAGSAENNQAFSISYRVTDGDGDTVDNTLTISVDDDTPVASTNSAALDTLTLDESVVDDPSTTTAVEGDGIRSVTANFANNFATLNYGTDGAGGVGYKLVLNLGTATSIGSGLYALDATDTTAATGTGNDGDGIGQGDQIMLVMGTGSDAGVVLGMAGGTEYFRISVDADGDVTFSQTAGQNIWHGTTTSGDEAMTLTTAAAGDLKVTQTLTDADGDQASASVNLGAGVFQIEDDGPTFTSTENLEVHRNPNATDTGSYVFNVGTDANSASFGAPGALVWDDKPTQYTFVRSGDTYTAKLGNTVYFTITLNPNTPEYTFNLITPVQPQPSTATPNLFNALTLFNLDGIKGTETAIVDASHFGGAFKLVMTGSSDDGVTFGGTTLLTKSSTDFGIDGNSIQEQADERLKIDVVQSAGFENVTLSFLTVNLSASGSIALNDRVDLKVTYQGGAFTILEEYYDNSGKLTFAIATGSVVDYVELIPVQNNINLKITGFEVTYTTAAEKADNLLHFSLTGVDGDGDSATTTFAVNIMAGTIGNDVIFGSSSAETISGGAGNDSISSLGGNDILIGGAGNDILTGGAGNDILTGGFDSDTFKWSLSDVGTVGNIATDTVKDFTVGSGGDVLDLRDVLDLNGTTSGQGWTGTPTQIATLLQNYIQFNQNGSNLELKIDTNGTTVTDVGGSNQGHVQTIVLENVTGSALGASDFAILEKLLTDGNLKTGV